MMSNLLIGQCGNCQPASSGHTWGNQTQTKQHFNACDAYQRFMK